MANAPPMGGGEAPPPEYAACLDDAEAPPSYDSLYGEFRSVRSPGGFASFVRKVVGIIVGTVLAAVLIAIISVIPIAMIVVGTLNLHNCPAERFIPIYLIVGGAFGLLKSLTNFFYRLKAEREEGETRPEDRVNPNPFDGILNCFLLGWFIAGSYWIYTTHPTFTDPKKPHYCDPTTYYFMMALISLAYILGALSLCFLCCCGTIALCCGPGRNTERT